MSCFVSQALKTQTRLSYIQIFTAPLSATQTQTWTRVSPLFGEVEEEWGGRSKWKDGGKKTNKLNNCIYLTMYTAREREGTEPIIGCALGRKQNSLLLPVPPQVLIKMPLSFQKMTVQGKKEDNEKKLSHSIQTPRRQQVFVSCWGKFGSLN